MKKAISISMLLLSISLISGSALAQDNPFQSQSVQSELLSMGKSCDGKKGKSASCGGSKSCGGKKSSHGNSKSSCGGSKEKKSHKTGSGSCGGSK